MPNPVYIEPKDNERYAVTSSNSATKIFGSTRTSDGNHLMFVRGNDLDIFGINDDRKFHEVSVKNKAAVVVLNPENKLVGIALGLDNGNSITIDRILNNNDEIRKLGKSNITKFGIEDAGDRIIAEDAEKLNKLVIMYTAIESGAKKLVAGAGVLKNLQMAEATSLPQSSNLVATAIPNKQSRFIS